MNKKDIKIYEALYNGDRVWIASDRCKDGVELENRYPVEAQIFEAYQYGIFLCGVNMLKNYGHQLYSHEIFFTELTCQNYIEKEL